MQDLLGFLQVEEKDVYKNSQGALIAVKSCIMHGCKMVLLSLLQKGRKYIFAGPG
jgi:hypothetical protein